MNLKQLIIFILFPLTGFGQVSLQPPVQGSFWEGPAFTGEGPYDFWPPSIMHFSDWIEHNSYREIILSEPSNSSMDSRPNSIGYLEYRYQFDGQGRLIRSMLFEVIHNLDEYTSEYRNNFEMKGLILDSNNFYDLPVGYEMKIDESHERKQLIKKNEFGDTIFLLIGDNSISSHALYSRILRQEYIWKHEENKFMSIEYSPVDSGLSGELGNVVDTSFAQLCMYEDNYLVNYSVLNDTKGRYTDHVEFEVERDTLEGALSSLLQFFPNDKGSLNDFIKYMDSVSSENNFSFEVHQIKNTSNHSSENKVRFKALIDEKEYHFLIVGYGPSITATRVKRFTNGDSIKEYFMVSKGQFILSKIEKYDASGCLIFQEFNSRIRFNYHYSEQGELIGESVLRRCRSNDNFSLKRRDLKQNYCIKRKDVIVLAPFSIIQQEFEVLKREGWNIQLLK